MNSRLMPMSSNCHSPTTSAFSAKRKESLGNWIPDGKLDAGTLEEIRNQGLELLGVVPHDDQVYQYDCNGKPIIQLPKDSPVRSALEEIVKKLGL